jgi:outer membrane protein TolC
VNTQRPHTVRDRAHDEVWELTLLQAVHLGVQNNKMIRTRATGGTLLQTPQNAASVYDIALRETGYLFGNRGVEAALADFDATFTSALTFGKNSTVSPSASPFAGGPAFINDVNTGAFTSSLGKTFANGGQIALNHNVNYLGTNAPFQFYPSSYNGISQIQYTQPLWAGAGVEYNRIAAPPRAGLGAVTGVSQGVAIARINTDITLADFENSVISMVKDTEDLYWELYLAYRQFDADSAQRESLLRTWREVKAKMDVGATGGNASNEAQARDAYFDARANVENSWATILSTENAFRKQLGLPVNDGRIIRPVDNPVEGEYLAQWESTLIDALTRRVELRKQKWQIKSLELQRKAAENVANPSLNFVGGYQVNGYGNDLLGQNNGSYNSFYGSMGAANQTGWNAGFQFSVPIGFRATRAQLRNIELQLIKARTALSAQELDISHELAESIQKIDVAYMTARTYLDRKVAAERRVQATSAEYEAGVSGATLDLVLRAQASNAAAEIAYYTSLVNYNKAITELHQRRGTLLENDGIDLSEGEWNTIAQQDAVRRAWARSFASPARNLRTEPSEFASPVPYPKTDLFPGAYEVHGLNSPTMPMQMQMTPTPVEDQGSSDIPTKAEE